LLRFKTVFTIIFNVFLHPFPVYTHHIASDCSVLVSGPLLPSMQIRNDLLGYVTACNQTMSVVGGPSEADYTTGVINIH